MINFCTHTIVRNGMPYIDLVLRQVIPFANRCLVTISEESNDGTLEAVNKLDRQFPGKISIYFENVKTPGELTLERQKQINHTYEDWILFLDADDYWSEDSLKEMVELINKEEDVDAYAVSPYQVINQRVYDVSWKNKWFTKWFKFQDGVHYERPWPRDLIFKGNEMLYWKVNPRVKRISARYFHLSNLMKWKFRDEVWAKEFESKIGAPLEYPDEAKAEILKIYDRRNQ